MLKNQWANDFLQTSPLSIVRCQFEKQIEKRFFHQNQDNGERKFQRRDLKLGNNVEKYSLHLLLQLFFNPPPSCRDNDT